MQLRVYAGLGIHSRSAICLLFGVREDNFNRVPRGWRRNYLEVWRFQLAREASQLREKEALSDRQRAEAEAARKEKAREARARAEAEAKRQEELAIVNEISNVVNACSNGDFSIRLTTEGREGVFKNF